MTAEEIVIEIIKQSIQETNKTLTLWWKYNKQISRDAVRSLLLSNFRRLFICKSTTNSHPIWNEKICKMITKSIISVDYKNDKITYILVKAHKSVYGIAENFITCLYKYCVTEVHEFEEFVRTEDTFKKEPIKAFLEFSF